MRWFAGELGYGADADFWALCGLLHDVDFERYPDQHCTKAAEILPAAGASEALTHAVCSHGYSLCQRGQTGARDGKGALCHR